MSTDSREVLLLLLPLALGVAVAILHFWMKIRSEEAGLPVKWWMTFGDESRMWQQYREYAKAHNWAVWPYYLYVMLIAGFLASVLIAVLAESSHWSK